MTNTKSRSELQPTGSPPYSTSNEPVRIERSIMKTRWLTTAEKRVFDYLLHNPGSSSVEVASALYPRVRNGESIVSNIMESLENKGRIDGSNRPIEDRW